jgi:spore coat polysaccharide biosynthesis protein SpsF
LRTVAIIQARMGSSRLRGKVLADIAGKTMLQRVIERVAAARGVDKIVVATTNAREDDILVERLNNQATCEVFRGSVDDVLSRFFECAKLHRAEIVVRVTADDPLKDPQIIDKAISLLKADPTLDYCSNTIEPSYPEGLDIEVIRFSSLERAHVDAQLASDREHVTPYIWKHPDLFNVLNFKSDRDLSDWRWTVDKPEDIEFMRRVFEEFRDYPLVPYQDVIAWLDLNPQIRLINSGISRNEGYLKSLRLENK